MSKLNWVYRGEIMTDVLSEIAERFWSCVEEEMLDESVKVTTRALSPEEAIGSPKRKDFPLLAGKEVLMQAEFRGSSGQAFTTAPRAFEGTLADVEALPLTGHSERAVLIATMNAVLRSMGLVRGTVHCKDDGPERCGKLIATRLNEEMGGRLGIVGFQPALVEHCVACLGCERVMVSDLNPAVVGTLRYGIEVMDGMACVDEMARKCDVLLITGTTLVNNTLDEILEAASAHGTDTVFYGTTVAGAAYLCGWKRLCPESK